MVVYNQWSNRPDPTYETECTELPSVTCVNASMSLEDIITRVNQGVPMQVPTMPDVYEGGNVPTDAEFDAYNSKLNPDLLTAEQDVIKRMQEAQQTLSPDITAQSTAQQTQPQTNEQSTAPESPTT